MRHTRLLVIPAVLLAATIVPVLAAGPGFWTLATAAGFLGGTSDGVSVSLSGTLRPGPALTNRLSSTPAQIWSLARGDDGTLWAGTGTDGRLIRLAAGQDEATVFDAGEDNIFAVAVSGSRVYAASSPDGQVYVVDGDEPARTFFDPEEPYIWALAVDATGNLWVGAGNPAALYRVAPDGTSEKVYAPPAAHVVSLAFDGTGRLLAGTESPGRLYRFDADNRPFVLLDSGLTELRAISTAPDGTIFAGAIDRGSTTADEGTTTSLAVTLAPASETEGATRRSALFRIAPDGTWEEIWSTADVVYDLAATADGSVLVATGPAGRLYEVRPDLDVLLLTGVDAHQITRFVRGTAPATVAAFSTSNPGRVVALGTSVQSPARYLSPVQDTRSVSTWGLIRWEASDDVELFTRSGNTATPDDSWSAWSEPYRRAEGVPITSPNARFLQWRVQFAADATPSSELSAVTVAYLPRNTRPAVTSITVHPPGVVFQRPYVNDESAIAGLDDEIAESRRPPGDTGPTPPAPGRRMFQKGLQTIAWTAEDDDDDRLEYTLEYRREDQPDWRLLRDDLTGTIFVWDTTTVADGRYLVRVRASDRAGNVGDRALTGDRESGPVTVDNTPPTVTVTGPANGVLSVQVVDGRSPIEKLEYAVAGGGWQRVSPVDGLGDSPDERYEIPLPAGTDPATVVLRATDLLQNVVSRPAAP